MAKESMQLGEAFSASVISGGLTQERLRQGPELKTRHYVLGWIAVAVLIAAVVGLAARALAEGVALQEGLKTKVVKAARSGSLAGIMQMKIIRGGKVVQEKTYKNQVVNAGETALRDCFGGTGTPTCTAVQNFKFHGLGTSATAIAETDTGCVAELTTQYNPDNTRATGTQTNNGANIYRTVATNAIDATVTVREWCIMSQAATGGGTMWARILTGDISLVSGDSLQTTYDLTIE